MERAPNKPVDARHHFVPRRGRHLQVSRNTARATLAPSPSGPWARVQHGQTSRDAWTRVWFVRYKSLRSRYVHPERYPRALSDCWNVHRRSSPHLTSPHRASGAPRRGDAHSLSCLELIAPYSALTLTVPRVSWAGAKQAWRAGVLLPYHTSDDWLLLRGYLPATTR